MAVVLQRPVANIRKFCTVCIESGPKLLSSSVRNFALEPCDLKINVLICRNYAWHVWNGRLQKYGSRRWPHFGTIMAVYSTLKRIFSANGRIPLWPECSRACLNNMAATGVIAVSGCVVTKFLFHDETNSNPDPYRPSRRVSWTITDLHEG